MGEHHIDEPTTSQLLRNAMTIVERQTGCVVASSSTASFWQGAKLGASFPAGLGAAGVWWALNLSNSLKLAAILAHFRRLDLFSRRSPASEPRLQPE